MTSRGAKAQGRLQHQAKGMQEKGLGNEERTKGKRWA